ncbi:DUF3418 domain-containing protein [Escherichia coli]
MEKVSRETPDLLNFEKSMLIKERGGKDQQAGLSELLASGQSQAAFDQFEPGADADGVTVHIPLPLLNPGRGKRV